MICRIYDVKGGNLDQYDAVVDRVGNDKPQGAHVHIAAPTDDGFMVIEVWDSTEDVDRYMAEGLGDAIQDVMQAGGVPEPKISESEVHKLDWVR